MKTIIKDSLILFAITLVAGLLLAVVNQITAPKIDEAKKKQKEEAASAVKGMLMRKERILPEPLNRVIRSRFRLLADALSEMLRNIICLRTEIADELFEGREFTCIENISAGAGDYHR